MKGKIITHNGDSQKILTSIASAVYSLKENIQNLQFMQPGYTGSDKTYRMGFTNNLTEILQDFYVFGLSDKLWEQSLVGERWEAFFVIRENYNFDCDN